MRIPTVIAHRGYALHYPENTLAAIRGALDAGARHIEVDVQLTADAVPVLFHDRTLKRVCAAEGAVHEKTLKQLRRLRASEPERFGERYSSERIATLQELCGVLRGHRDARAFIEVKRVALERFEGAQVLNATSNLLKPVRDRCVLISFSPGFLACVRQAQPDTAIGIVVDRWEQLADPDVKALQAEYVFCDLDGVPEAGTLARDGARLAIYEVPEARRALELGARGADFIETFACGEMIDALRAATVTGARDY